MNQSGMGPQMAPDIPKYAEMLQQYSHEYAKLRKHVEQKDQPQEPQVRWYEDIIKPDQGMDEGKPSFIDAENFNSNDVILHERAEGNTGDQQIDRNQALQKVMSHPVMMEYGDQIEELIEELVKQVQDPDNPLTEEEAQSLFIEMMNSEYGHMFQ